jgi:hypothetical protein
MQTRGADHAASFPASLGTNKSFLVLFRKKEQMKKNRLFEKRGKNFCLLGARGAAGARGPALVVSLTSPGAGI